MGSPRECVIDTMILQKANAPLTRAPRERSDFVIRLALLKRIERRDLIVLISQKVLHQYRQQIPKPRNDLIRSFFELLTAHGAGPVKWNRKRQWAGADQDKARKCRFPYHDVHLLRTAAQPQESTIVTEEPRLLITDRCIHREFRVHIRHPRSV
jgi:hypothetical protein